MASSGPIRNHRDLIVWQKAMVLRRGVLPANLPPRLTRQLMAMIKKLQ